MRKVWKKCILLLTVFLLSMGIPQGAYAADTMQVTAIAVSSSKIELNWKNVEGAKGYAIYRSNSSEGGFQKQKEVSSATTVYRDTKVSAAVVYYYKIVPINRSTGKEMKTYQAVVKARTPEKVEIEKITSKSPTQIKLIWSASAGSNGYEIYRSGSGNGNYKKIAQINGKNTLTYTDSEVTPGKTYYYKLRPTNKILGQTGVGNFSEPVKGKTLAKTNITSITSVSSNRMQITWKKVNGAQSYEIYRSTKANSGFKKIATVKASKNKYADMTVKSGKKYYYKIVTAGSLNGTKITSGYSEAAGVRSLQQVKVSSVKATADDELKIKWGKVTGATEYKIYRSTSKTGSYKKIAEVPAKGTPILSYIDEKVISGKTYYYKVQAYAEKKGLITAGSGNRSEAVSGSTAYAIMGKTTVTAEQMVAFFNVSGRKYPASTYKDKGAKNLEKFCDTVISESEKEGVRAEVIFAQICLETGYLQFGGQVSASQCNFAGLGATDDGAAGATFSSVKVGIRAQVQHMKGYASKEELNEKCVDPRFVYLASRRGSAAYVQDLGGGNWATDPNYASKLMTMIKAMKKY